MPPAGGGMTPSGILPRCWGFRLRKLILRASTPLREGKPDGDTLLRTAAQNRAGAGGVGAAVRDWGDASRGKSIRSAQRAGAGGRRSTRVKLTFDKIPRPMAIAAVPGKNVLRAGVEAARWRARTAKSRVAGAYTSVNGVKTSVYAVSTRVYAASTRVNAAFKKVNARETRVEAAGTRACAAFIWVNGARGSVNHLVGNGHPTKKLEPNAGSSFDLSLTGLFAGRLFAGLAYFSRPSFLAMWIIRSTTRLE
jgi:hypothetical protein